MSQNLFHEYLTNKKCKAALCNVLIQLDKLQEKPQDPIDYLRRNLSPEATAHIEEMKLEIKHCKGVLKAIERIYPKIYAKYMKKKEKRKKNTKTTKKKK